MTEDRQNQEETTNAKKPKWLIPTLLKNYNYEIIITENGTRITKLTPKKAEKQK